MHPSQPDPVNILLVDDQPAKLLSYEVILSELGENLIKASSAREALTCLLKNDVALVLIDVCMPELDGFELATMIREHPRFQKTALIFVSAVQVSEFDRLRGYEAGAVDYVPVPVIPEVLRAKAKVFVELHRKTRELEQLNAGLEERVAERTAALAATAARLQESEQRRSLALAAGRMGSWEWDLLTGEIHWDEGQYRIFGVDPEGFRLCSESVEPLIHPDDLERIRRTGRDAAQDGLPYHCEFRILRPDGEMRWCIAAGAPSHDALGQPIRLSGVMHDITERRRAEEGLQQQNEELEQLVEERTREREVALAQLFEAQKVDTIGHLTGGVAHDFNNLLMAVLGSLELLKKRLPANDDRAHRLLDNAVQGAERGAALTQRLLAFARRQELRPQSVDVARLIQGMQDLLERSLGPEIQIDVAISELLPPVQADANQLELAILNLAVNARDAMPRGGSLRVSARKEQRAPNAAGPLKAMAPGDYICIEVSDSGIGMDEETLLRASEPFFTTKGPGKGTGLGLSMVHGLAAQLGGAMKVSSRVGLGTTVHLWLPQADRLPDDALLPIVDDEGYGTADPAIASLLIMVVDDDALVRNGTTAMLEDMGHVVIEAESGSQALQRFTMDSAGIDLLITDQAMPGMKGLELIGRLKTLQPGLPMVLASGFADIEENGNAHDIPRLSKPFRARDLAAAIEQAFHLTRRPLAKLASSEP